MLLYRIFPFFGSIIYLFMHRFWYNLTYYWNYLGTYFLGLTVIIGIFIVTPNVCIRVARVARSDLHFHLHPPLCRTRSHPPPPVQLSRSIQFIKTLNFYRIISKQTNTQHINIILPG